MLSGPYSAVAAMISVSGEATAQAASRIFVVIEAVVLGLTRSSFMVRMVPCRGRGWKRHARGGFPSVRNGFRRAATRAYTIPSPASVPCRIRRRRSSEMKSRLAMMTRNDTPVVTVPSA